PFILAVIIWIFDPWRPLWVYDFKISKEMLCFGGIATLTLFFGWILHNVDQIFIGRFLGEGSLGIYQVGYRFGMLFYLYLAAPLSLVFYSAFCKMQEDLTSLKYYYFSYLRFTTLLIFPACLMFYVLSPAAINICLDMKWHPCIPIVQLFAVFCTLVSFVAVNVELFRAVNRQDILLKVLLARVVFTVPLLYFASKDGIVDVCRIHILASLLFLPINLFFVKKVLKWSMVELWSPIKNSVIILIVLISTSILLQKYIFKIYMFSYNEILRFVSTGVILFVVYLSLLVKFEKKLIRDFFSFINDSLSIKS
ncbi:oligosaccharide flippase family protein, partial [Thermoproteota archaeon]